MQSPRRHRPTPPLGSGTPDARTGERIRGLERAAHLAVLAPSVHDTQPWRLELHSDRLVLRAARSRQLTMVDPTGRELVQSVGAALFNARVALAAEGWAADVERLPDPGDLDLLAVVRPVPGAPDTPLAALAAAVPRRRTNRRAFATGELPDEGLRGLTESAAAEEVVLVPVLSEGHRRLVARLTRQADNVQNAEPVPERGAAALDELASAGPRRRAARLGAVRGRPVARRPASARLRHHRCRRVADGDLAVHRADDRPAGHPLG
jgi:hypothetical protein